MGPKILLIMLLLFIAMSGIGAILSGAVWQGIAHLALVVIILAVSNWRKRRKAERMAYMQFTQVDKYKTRR